MKAFTKLIREARIDETTTWRKVAELAEEEYKARGLDGTTIPLKGHLEAIDNRLKQLQQEGES